MCRLFLVTIGCLLILFGISLQVLMPAFIQQKIESKMELKIGTKNYERFTNIPIALTVKFYLFNVTNSDKVLQGLERPQFEEIGPFMYKQRRRREVVDILDNNRKLVYKEYKTFYPVPMPKQQQTNNDTNDNSNNIRLTVNHVTSLHNNGSISDYNNHNNNYITTIDNAAKQATTSINNNNNNNDANTNVRQLDPNLVNITMVNVPLLSVLTQLAQFEAGSLKRQLAAKVLSRLILGGKEKILVTRPASELLFDGYKVGLMEQADDLITNTFGYNFEPPLPNNKFGFFHGKNGTWSKKEAGEMTIFTGRNNSMDQFMLVDNWNGLKQLKVWPSNTEAGNRCNEIRGTDGSQFHPGVTRESILNIFSPMICTSIFLKYKEDTSVRGIPLYRFISPPEVFAAPKKNPRNACYCTIPPTTSSPLPIHQQQSPADYGGSSKTFNNGQQQLSADSKLSSASNKQLPSITTSGGSGNRPRITNSRCYIDGLIDLSLCQRGAPVAASTPHFYNADPMLAMASGLKPDPLLHETHLDIEPMTGAVLRAASRAQINAYVESAALDVVDSQLIGHMTPMVAPLFWLEESAEIDEKSTFELKSKLLNTVDKLNRTCLMCVIIGLLILIVVGVQYWYVACYRFDSVRAKKRLAARERLASNTARRLRNRKRRQRKLAGLGADARQSNVAAMTNDLSSLDDADDNRDSDRSSSGFDDDLDRRRCDLDDEASTSAAKKLESPLRLPVSRKAGADFRRVQRDKRRSGDNDTVSPGVAKTAAGARDDGDDDEDRNLVQNEWPAGEITRSQTSQSDSGGGGGHRSISPEAGSKVHQKQGPK